MPKAEKLRRKRVEYGLPRGADFTFPRPSFLRRFPTAGYLYGPCIAFYSTVFARCKVFECIMFDLHTM